MEILIHILEEVILDVKRIVYFILFGGAVYHVLTSSLTTNMLIINSTSAVFYFICILSSILLIQGLKKGRCIILRFWIISLTVTSILELIFSFYSVIVSFTTLLAVRTGIHCVIKFINMYCVIFLIMVYRKPAPQRVQPTEGLNEMQLPVISRPQYERCTCASDPVFEFVYIGRSHVITRETAF
ncbi:hypothetical protein TNCT_535571 [Trichonephila clavata]|uniref:Uncharacterized protein n=1 Tax=Trichonephila clavata TaxID=2740835 RepID=A0A8X6HJR9_TRICU|nr:hypothetical protein TNCT_535571 [Trichonephila clavata]